MTTRFTLTDIPEELWHIFGTPEEDTKIYRREGSAEEQTEWFEALVDLVGPVVSPGGVSMYCPVTRAAVHKRVKEGKLSLFLFHAKHQKTTLFGKKKILRASPIGFVPVGEAKAWRDELEQRAIEQGKITREELEGAKPDWCGDFVEWKQKHGKGTVL